MSLGKRPREQQEMWIPTTALPKSPGHVFYRKLNQLLAEADFDRYVERLCKRHYAEGKGRPSIPPGNDFRMLMVGYFEGIGSQRGIAWRCADSLSLREFLGLGPQESSPDHSSLTRVRDRLPLEVHEKVFLFILKLASKKGLLRGKTVAIDSTTLEANAAMKTIVRRDTGEDWKEYLRGLVQEEEGIETPTDEELRRFDKQRKNKRVSNRDWISPSDPDSRITRMKDGQTHLAYKAENVVDLNTELILSARIYHADQSDQNTLLESFRQAKQNTHRVSPEVEILEVVADKGYHKAETLACLTNKVGVRSYLPEPDRKYAYRWTDKPEAHKRAVYNNRRRLKRAYGKARQRLRSEYVERSFAHICETGGSRRTWLRTIEKVRKRYLVSAAIRNLGLIMRELFGIGTARSLQGEGAFFCFDCLACFIHRCLAQLPEAVVTLRCLLGPPEIAKPRTSRGSAICVSNFTFSTGC